MKYEHLENPELTWSLSRIKLLQDCQRKSRLKCSQCNYREVCFELEQEIDKNRYMV